MTRELSESDFYPNVLGLFYFFVHRCYMGGGYWSSPDFLSQPGIVVNLRGPLFSFGEN
jgi:hypothetical protein